jgi:hypothetical protein
VAFRASDLLGNGSAVDTVTGSAETDPGDADGVVGAGREEEFALEGAAFGGFGEDGRVEGVIGIADRNGDMEVANRAFGSDAADAAGEVAQQASPFVESAQVAAGEADADAGGAFWRRPLGIGDNEFRAGRDAGPVHGGVQVPDETGMRAGTFGDEFEE